MLLCGADVLASMAVPGVWRNPGTILEEFGVVCLEREGASLASLLRNEEQVLDNHQPVAETGKDLPSSSDGISVEDDLLWKYRRHITLIKVQEGGGLEGKAPVGGRSMSSTEVRHRLHEGKGISGLVPQNVEAYIRQHGLYQVSLKRL